MPDTTIVLPSQPRAVSEETAVGQYEIDGLYPGYGHTLGNSLRRIILSSLPGAAITTVKINGVDNEFSVIEGVSEDVITILLNLKNVRITMHTDEPQTLKLKASGKKQVTAGDIETTGETEVANPDHVIATITNKDTELDMEMTVEKGLGYLPKDALKEEKAEIGVIHMDAVFTPIRRVNYEVENMRVGDRTDYNRLRMHIETDGTISPRDALDRSLATMQQQFQALVEGTAGEEPTEAELEQPSSITQEAASDKDTVSDTGEEVASDDETEFLKTRIEDLDLSSRTMNALSQANIRTVGGLARKKEDDLREIDGLGDKGIAEIKELLAQHNVELKQ